MREKGKALTQSLALLAFLSLDHSSIVNRKRWFFSIHDLRSSQVEGGARFSDGLPAMVAYERARVLLQFVSLFI
jgi:hypothetical protein